MSCDSDFFFVAVTEGAVDLATADAANVEAVDPHAYRGLW